MSRSADLLDLLDAAAAALGELVDDVVFVGGATVALHLSDAAAPDVRPTRDVDVIVDVTSLVDYHMLSDRLRARGFREDTEDGAPICRWRAGELILDVMPTDEAILGFSSRWYREAMRTAVTMALPSGRPIRVVTPAMLLTTKLQAYLGRGGDDPYASHDLEDALTLIDGREELPAEVRACDSEVGGFVATTLGKV